MEIEWPNKDGEMLRGKIPAHVQLFVDAIGLDDTAKLLLELGGAPIYVTPTPKNRSRVVELIGREKAIAIGEAFGFGMMIRLPIGNSFLCRYLRSKGVPILEIARRIRLSDVSVRRNLRTARPPRHAPDIGKGGR